MNEKLSLNAIEVAELLNITKNTVYELVKRGELPGYKIGKKLRIDKSDVENYINNQKRCTILNKNETIKNHNELFYKNRTVSIDSESNKDIIIAGQDSILDILCEHVKLRNGESRILRSNVGSYTNLYDLYNEKISICSAHLWDGYLNDYNTEYVKKLLPGVPCILINLAYRKQGFYVAKGNPLKIKTWTDLIKDDVSIVNREKGSGTRILLDEKLRVNNINPKDIKGYNIEKTSHLSIASAIARGEAVVGMGIEKVALGIKNIDFIPMQEERYDLVIKKNDMNTEIFKLILEIVKSNEFREEIEGLSGYDVRDIGTIVAYT